MELTENLKKCMSPEARKQFGRAGLTNEEHEANACVKLEKELHNQYIGFLRMHGLDYYHAPMHKRSSLIEGQPDFGVYRDSMLLLVEFKIGNNEPSEVQSRRIEHLKSRGNVTLVARSYESAIRETKRFFDL